jgi:hypothetical protein
MNNKNLPQTLVMNEGVQGGRSLSSTTDSAAAPASAEQCVTCKSNIFECCSGDTCETDHNLSVGYKRG